MCSIISKIMGCITPNQSKKLWAIGEHRVKKSRGVVDTKMVWTDDGPPYFDSWRTQEDVWGTVYVCEDCEKEFEEREEFKDEECYEVIDES